MLAFFGEQQLKDTLVGRMRQHEEMDSLEQGNYSTCFIGCLGKFPGATHYLWPKDFGLPMRLAVLSEYAFENCSDKRRETICGDILEAIPVGAVFDDAWLHPSPGSSCVDNMGERINLTDTIRTGIEDYTDTGHDLYVDRLIQLLQALPTPHRTEATPSLVTPKDGNSSAIVEDSAVPSRSCVSSIAEDSLYELVRKLEDDSQ